MTKHACPSAECAPGATLLGVLGDDGRIKHLRTPMRIDADFVTRARAQGEPEARMRFASTCQEGNCGHWSGKACGLIDKVMAQLEPQLDRVRAETLPPCTIRVNCRWYAQSGHDACSVCDLVVRLPEPAAAE